MLREIDEKLIAPGMLMSSSDMARLGCAGCQGCSDCCRERADSITLDAYDIQLMKTGLNYSFEGLLSAGLISFSVVDSVVLPCLAVKEGTEECVFLEEGRCSIHSCRPGICRMFPLARLYHEDGTFSYFLQEGECTHSNGVKIRISKWLEYPDLRGYESAVRQYHDALTALRRILSSGIGHEEQVAMQRQFLDVWFVNSAPFV